jgi:hypothetical protein
LKFVSGTLALNHGKGFTATTTYRLYIKCENKNDVKISKSFLNKRDARKIAVEKSIPSSISTHTVLDENDTDLLRNGKDSILTKNYLIKKYF